MLCSCLLNALPNALLNALLDALLNALLDALLDALLSALLSAVSENDVHVAQATMQQKLIANRKQWRSSFTVWNTKKLGITMLWT